MYIGLIIAETVRAVRLKRCMRVARTVERLDAAKSVAHDKITSRSGDKGRRRLIRASPGGRRSRSSSERRCQSTFDCRRDTPMTGYKRRSRQNGQRTARLGASRPEHTRRPPRAAITAPHGQHTPSRYRNVADRRPTLGGNNVRITRRGTRRLINVSRRRVAVNEISTERRKRVSK